MTVAMVGSMVVTTMFAAPLAVTADAASTYTVSAGDSLWLIAEQHDVSIRDLVDANGLSVASTIHPGQQLTIPGGPTGDETVPANVSQVAVRPGDSLWSIAHGAGVSLGALLAVSGLSVNSVIHPGQLIAVPRTSSPANRVTTIGAAAADATTYTVRPGDGFSAIARRLGVSVRSLLDANSLSLSTVIHPGQRLTVPESSVPNQVQTSDHLVAVFERAASEVGIPADLLMAVAYVESRWRQSARSSAGAVGVGQLMPATAAWVARDLMGEPGLDIADTTDNIRMSAHLLEWLLDEADGNADRALAMYLQGVYGVRANGISDAAVTYAEKVSVLRRQFR